MAECREAMSLAWVRDETVLVLDVVEILLGATWGVGDFGLVFSCFDDADGVESTRREQMESQ